MCGQHGEYDRNGWRQLRMEYRRNYGGYYFYSNQYRYLLCDGDERDGLYGIGIKNDNGECASCNYRDLRPNRMHR